MNIKLKLCPTCQAYTQPSETHDCKKHLELIKTLEEEIDTQGDTEALHCSMDHLLLNFINNKKINDIWNNTELWYA